MIEIQPLPYQTNSETLFAPFATQAGSIWLDSGRPQNQQGRYDIISAFPYCTVTTYSAKTQIKTNNEIVETIKNPFSVLNSMMANMIDKENSFTELPFLGGAIGYWSYDLGRTLEELPAVAKQDISLPDMVIGIYAWAIIVDHVEKKSVLMVNKGLTKRQENWKEIERSIFQKLDFRLRGNDNSTVIPAKAEIQSLTKNNFILEKSFTPQITKIEYAEKFQQIKQHLQAGDCYQVNLTQRFTAQVSGSSWAAYQTIRQKIPTPYSAFLNLENSAILCHSPERFLQVRDNVVETKPIKGTRPRRLDLIQNAKLAMELIHSEKDRAENTMIVDLLRNDLSKVCELGSVQVEKLCALEGFANVYHLVSTITGKLSKNKTAIDLLAACFPGGSITGAPKLRAMEIIEVLEPSRRSVYCGAIGYIDVRGNMDTNIPIRTLIWDRDQLHCSAGGGITIGSECDAEYQESLDKIEALLKALR